MSKDRLDFGKAGEALAVNFLKKQGYKILEQNYKNKFGEVDIIAKDKDVICFVEVKTRSGLNFGLPQEAVNFRKQRQITKVALSFLKEKKLLEDKARFDVLTILNDSKSVEFNLLKDAFELSSSYTY